MNDASTSVLDMAAYNHSVSSLILQPVQGPSGMYHVKNGVIHHGYAPVGIDGFSVSQDYWNIFH
jgi:hypothetical protein